MAANGRQGAKLNQYVPVSEFIPFVWSKPSRSRAQVIPQTAPTVVQHSPYVGQQHSNANAHHSTMQRAIVHTKHVLSPES